MDLFASAAHHQIARYYTLYAHDRNAAGVDSLDISWTDEVRPYINPSRSLVGRVLTNIANEGVTSMPVIHDWMNAHWHHLWNQLFVLSTVLTCPIYFNADDTLRPKPWWNTRTGIVNGKLKP